MDDEKTCCICREDILFDGARPEPCSHMFHKECIEQWSQISNTCPLCKVRFTVLQCGSTSVSVEDKVQVMSSQVEDELNRAAIELALNEDGGASVADQRRYFADDSAAHPELLPPDGYESDPGFCCVCGMLEHHIPLLICEGCEGYFHTLCVGLRAVPREDWYCQTCVAGQARQLEEIQQTRQARDRRLNEAVPSPSPVHSRRSSRVARHRLSPRLRDFTLDSPTKPSDQNSPLHRSSNEQRGRNGHSRPSDYLAALVEGSGYESDPQCAVAIVDDGVNQVINRINRGVSSSSSSTALSRARRSREVSSSQRIRRNAYEEDEEYVPSDRGTSSDDIDQDESSSSDIYHSSQDRSSDSGLKRTRLRKRRVSTRANNMLDDDEDDIDLDFEDSDEESDGFIDDSLLMRSESQSARKKRKKKKDKKKRSKKEKKSRKKKKRKKRDKPKKKKKRKHKSNLEFLQSSSQLKRHVSPSKSDRSPSLSVIGCASEDTKSKSKKRVNKEPKEKRDVPYSWDSFHSLLSKREERSKRRKESKSPTPVSLIQCGSSSSLLSSAVNPGNVDISSCFGSSSMKNTLMQREVTCPECSLPTDLSVSAECDYCGTHLSDLRQCSDSIRKLALKPIASDPDPESPYIRRPLSDRVNSNRKRRKTAEVDRQFSDTTMIMESNQSRCSDISSSSSSTSSSSSESNGFCLESPVPRHSHLASNIDIDQLTQTVKMKRRPKKSKRDQSAMMSDSLTSHFRSDHRSSSRMSTLSASTVDSIASAKPTLSKSSPSKSKRDFVLGLALETPSRPCAKPKRKRKLSEVDS